MKSWLKSKTMWAGVGVGVLGVIQTALQDAPMDESTAGIVMAAVGALMMVLRAVTTQPIGPRSE